MRHENMSTRDRDIRLGLVGPLAVLALFFLNGTWSIVVGGIALILLITAAIGFCPLYQLLGITKPRAQDAAAKESASRQH